MSRRLAFLAPAADLRRLNGETIHVQEIASALARRGHEVHLLAQGASAWGEAAKHGVSCHEVPSARVPGWAMLSAGVRARRMLSRLMRRERLDLVHERSYPGNPGVAEARRAGAASVVEVNGLMDRELLAKGRSPLLAAAFRRLARRTLPRADRVLVVAPTMTRVLVEEYGVPRAIVRHVGNGVDVARFAAAAPRRLPAVGGDGFAVGFVGSFAPWHRLDVVVGAADLVRREAPETRFLLVGEGPGLAAIRREVEARGLAGTVLLPGRVRPAEVPSLVRGFDVGLVVKEEGVPGAPIKAYECMAAGLPVVATDSEDLRDVLGEEGAFFVPNTPEGVAAGVLRARRDPALRRRQGEANAARAAARHSWDAVAARVEAVHDEALARSRGVPGADPP